MQQHTVDSQAKQRFNTIALVGRPRNHNALQMHKNIYHWLQERGHRVLVEDEIAKGLDIERQDWASLDNIGAQADLAIVIGGDGNMLGKARILARYDIAVIGINRGHLGFLTDIDPKNAYSQLHALLEGGEYFIEERFLLDAFIERDGVPTLINNAVNEVVIHPAKIAHMIDFQVYIDNKFAFSQRSDGLIISTPTGSTAYSLSAGGPILTPQLNAIALVPMFPHTLSSRPLVIDGNSVISLRFAQYTERKLEISCDSQVAELFSPDDKIIVRKSPDTLRLVHLNDYNYFNVLSSKLGWLKKLF
ncbi:NAD(+) kinase [Pasteurellaceae bacterium HPA106]|uniref:NAD(+) kinase n=1 Tax=Spirabiliibacterium pneumoniae TaxID=221400 RepID=UPI001AAC9769|nr:NAD(+) kinase [Spirabiliibacterium pneumoniae]MBE2895674.1 NAD(+) kinase [Spirabiliibacterium pneumoniae]